MLIICVFLTVKLSSSFLIGETQIPPLGRFLDPFHGFQQNYTAEFVNNLEVDNIQIEEPVDIFIDSLQIPHIYAKNDNDLMFALGYFVAEQRLWQMDFQSKAAEGRVAEIVGKKAIPFDQKIRRTAMKRGAQKTLELTKKNPEIYSQLVSYSEGVNAYISKLEYKNYPIEYKLLDYEPELWSPIKSAYILEYMVNSLINNDSDIEKTNLRKMLGKEKFELFFPYFESGLDPVVPTLKPWEFTPLDVPKEDSTYIDNLNTPSIYFNNDIDETQNNGSNNWAISGKKTKNGHAILANDPHLNLRLPSLWILVHLISPNKNVMGFTFTGAPAVTIGFNKNIAWGFTNAPADQRDWFKIKFKDNTRNEYYYDGKILSTEKVIEKIEVRDAETFIDTVVYTIHGPIVYDDNFPGEAHNLAYRWIGNEPSNTFTALNKINNSRNYNEFDNALTYWDSPSQNAVFASVEGDIAMRISGMLPLKWNKQGTFILDGSKSSHNWQGIIPKNQNPVMKNPNRGFVSSANQHSVDPEYPYFIYASNALEHFRNRRINRTLSNMSEITVADVKRLQIDNYSIKAEENLPLLMNLLPKNESDILDMLHKWDYIYSADSKAAVFFEIWWNTFYHYLWDEFKSDSIPLIKPSHFTTYNLLRQGKVDTIYFDNKGTKKIESLADLVESSFLATEKRVKENPQLWYEYNELKLIHLTQQIDAFSTDVIRVGGAGHTINASKGSHGPSLRMVVELTDPPTAWGVYPGGQSGNPGSIFYNNYTDTWATNKYFKLDISDKVKSNHIVHLNLKPN